MKVLFVHDHRFYESDGKYYSYKFSQQTWEPYLQGGNDVIVCARKTQKICTQLASTDSRVKYCLTSSFTGALSAIKNYGNICKELTELVKDADCIIVRLPSILGIFAAQIAKKFQKKILAEVVGDAYDAYKYYGTFPGQVAAPIYKILNRNTVNKADAVLYVTKEYLQKLYPSKGLTFGCSDILLAPVPVDILNQRIIKIGHESTDFICGEVGNISLPYKGYEVMIKAMSILKDRGKIVQFYVVGGGNPEYFYKQAEIYGVRDQVCYCGVKDHDNINQFYDSLDIYVHPSYTEGCPRVVVEAMSRGCPCLASCAGGIPELVNKMCIHNIGDANKLADDIELLYKNKEIRKQLAIENYQCAKEYYSDSILSKRMGFYKKFFQL